MTVPGKGTVWRLSARRGGAITRLFSLVGDRKDTVLVAFQMTLYLTALYLDPPCTLNDPGEEPGSTGTDVLSRIPECRFRRKSNNTPVKMPLFALFDIKDPGYGMCGSHQN
jgi:hypothetical protein